MRGRTVFTQREDALIVAAQPEQVTDLALRLGRTRKSVMNRRQRLLRWQATGKPPHTRKATVEFEGHKVTPVTDVLAGRPDWFHDDLSLKLRSGR
jgi:hypothetical protein